MSEDVNAKKAREHRAVQRHLERRRFIRDMLHSGVTMEPRRMIDLATQLVDLLEEEKRRESEGVSS